MKHLEELVQHAIDGIKDRGEGMQANKLHQMLFNEDYYIIGYYQAEEWLKANVGIFAAIDRIKEYEQDNFGKVTTDLSSSESVVNMYVYIIGEELLNDIQAIGDNWDDELDSTMICKIIEELESLISNTEEA